MKRCDSAAGSRRPEARLEKSVLGWWIVHACGGGKSGPFDSKAQARRVLRVLPADDVVTSSARPLREYLAGVEGSGSPPEGEARFRHALLTLFAVASRLAPEAAPSPGTEFGAAFVADSRPWRALGAVGAADREAAKADLLRRVGNPIHPGRRHLVAPELVRQAALHHRKPKEELRARVESTFFACFEPHPGRLVRSTPRQFRATLNREVTADCLGKDWRQARRMRSVDEVAERLDVAEQYHQDWAELETVGTTAAALLPMCWEMASPRTREVMSAYLELLQQNPKATVSDAARAVGMSPKTAHTLYDRLEAKARARMDIIGLAM